MTSLSLTAQSLSATVPHDAAAQYITGYLLGVSDNLDKFETIPECFTELPGLNESLETQLKGI